MAEVRLANTEYREGKITEALERLRRDGRIKEAESADKAYDLLTCAWHAERQRRIAEPNRRWSAITAEHHFERRELNARARALLGVDGTLNGSEVRIAGLSFRSGDEVIARVTERFLRAKGAARDAYVRNGSLGTVVEVKRADLSATPNVGDESPSLVLTSNGRCRLALSAAFSIPTPLPVTPRKERRSRSHTRS